MVDHDGTSLVTHRGKRAMPHIPDCVLATDSGFEPNVQSRQFLAGVSRNWWDVTGTDMPGQEMLT